MGVFVRGRKLWITFKAPDGRWRNVASGLFVGDEDKARAMFARLDATARAARDAAAGADAGPLTVARYADTWIGKRKQLGLDWKNDEQRLRMHILPVIGPLPLASVRTKQIADLFRAMRSAGRLAPRTRWTIYSVVRSMFRDAKIDDLVAANPCELTKYEIGSNEDKDPEWRAQAVFSRAEVEKLIADSRIPPERQLLYALGAIAGLRHGEIAGLRWRHYDATIEPLGRLLIATSYDKGRTKTKRTRQVPVHPTLAAMLAEWRLRGWEQMLGRQPEADDLILPLPPDEPNKRARPNPRAGGMRDKNDSRRRWVRDLAELALRHRRGHDLRATFITLAIDDGAEPYVLERVTHTPKGRSAFDGYSRTQWETLCREVAKLKISRSTRGDVVTMPMRATAGGGPSAAVEARGLTTPITAHYRRRNGLISIGKVVEAPGVEFSANPFRDHHLLRCREVGSR